MPPYPTFLEFLEFEVKPSRFAAFACISEVLFFRPRLKRKRAGSTSVFVPLRGIRGRHAHHIPRSSKKSPGPAVRVVQRRDGVVSRRREEVGPSRARGVSGLDFRCDTEYK